ncbi:multidrug efflux MFS transporter NorA [Metabacillus malikii]|uniref:DHA1 family multidrug resistance protein-like MFS transporter n=1 Tax=Metabacillus malikii TaxID=1504265 RepID=A0ABT9ZIK3_9BACI|nr:multidrug efflux MFS transporter NorA [Metabacillus malikii]MDQ0231065.1 DHA1 family multidrug resistance protein-like MFS transporter [Metabacillus malikii]
MKKQNMTLAILLTNLFIAFLGIGLVIPVMPTIMNEMNLTGAIVGYLVGAFAIAQLISSPIAGRWADNYGRKKMITIGLLIFSLSELLFAVGEQVGILFLSRVLGGISAAFIMPAVTAFIADITTPETRPKALGYMSAAISTGFIIGPGIGGFLAELGHRVPFYSASILALIAAIFSVVMLREPEQKIHEEQTENMKSGFKRVFDKKYFFAFLILFISSFGLAAFESLFSLFVDHKFSFSPKDIAIAITGGAIVGAIAQVALFDRATAIFGEIKLVRYSLIFSVVLVYLMTVVHTYFLILVVTVTVFVGFDLMRPALTSYLSKIAGNEQGFVGGMNSMFTSIGNVLGPIIGGILFDIDLNYPFYFATVFLAIGVAISLAWKNSAQPKQQQTPSFQDIN